MTIRKSLRLTVGAFAAMSVLVGCAGAPSPRMSDTNAASTTATADIVFGPAKPFGTVDVRQRPDGSVAAADWPDTCALLTGLELLAILPQATDFKKSLQPVDVYEDVVVQPDGSIILGRTTTVPKGGCDYTFELPATSPGRHALSLNPPVQVMLPVIAAPPAVEQHYEKNRSKWALRGALVELGALGAECFGFPGTDAIPTIACHHKRFYFEVKGTHPRVKPDETWRDKVLTEVARTLVAKMG